jgi:hypothetical protein
MKNGIVVMDEHKPMTAATIREQVNLIQEVMKDVMQGPSKENPEGVHFGIIPGCKKPSLLKPGAEKLSMVFRLRPIINSGSDIINTDMGNGHREITVYCHVFNMGGVELATGVGSCSTMESKYRYRGGEKVGTGQPVPSEYWNLKKAGKKDEAQELIGGPGFGPGKIDGVWQICEIGEKMDNPDIADQYNTVLKMAKKRAYVDGILSATAASDIFTQDVEEMAPPEVKVDTAPVAPPVQQPARKDEPVNAEVVAPAGNVISESQGKRLYAIWKGAGKKDADVMAYLQDTYGVSKTKDISKDDYEKICAWAAAK